MDEVVLLAADDEKLLILRLEKPNADGQVKRHCPEFNSARKVAVERIDHEDHEEIDMQNQNRHQSEADLAHLDDWMIAMQPDIDAGDEEGNGVDDGDGNLRDAIAVVVCIAPVVTSSVEIVDHVAYGTFDRALSGCCVLLVSIDQSSYVFSSLTICFDNTQDGTSQLNDAYERGHAKNV